MDEVTKNVNEIVETLEALGKLGREIRQIRQELQIGETSVEPRLILLIFLLLVSTRHLCDLSVLFIRIW